MPKKRSDLSSEHLILEAARKVFTEKGYAATRMQDIADETGMNQALLHYYFRSKDKLFNQIFEAELQGFIDSYVALWEEEKPLLDKLEAILEQEAQRFRLSPHIPMFLLHEMSHGGDKTRQKIIERLLSALPQGAIVAQIDLAVAEGVICPIEPSNLLLLVMSLVVFPFMAKSIVKQLSHLDEAAFDHFIDKNILLAKLMLRSALQMPVAPQQKL